MFTQATVNERDTRAFPASLLDPSAEEISLIAANGYKWISDRYLGTSGGLSWAFGENGSTLTFMPVDDIDYLHEALSPLQVSKKNLEAIKLLEEWFAEPDDLGEDFWKEFDKELKANRFSIS